MMPFFLILLVVVVLLLLFGRRRDGQGQESALDILKKRYARGEISQEEFERMKRPSELTAPAPPLPRGKSPFRKEFDRFPSSLPASSALACEATPHASCAA